MLKELLIRCWNFTRCVVDQGLEIRCCWAIHAMLGYPLLGSRLASLQQPQLLVGGSGRMIIDQHLANALDSLAGPAELVLVSVNVRGCGHHLDLWRSARAPSKGSRLGRRYRLPYAA